MKPIYSVIRSVGVGAHSALIVMDRRSCDGRAGWEIDVLYLALGISAGVVHRVRCEIYGNPYAAPAPAPSSPTLPAGRSTVAAPRSLQKLAIARLHLDRLLARVRRVARGPRVMLPCKGGTL